MVILSAAVFFIFFHIGKEMKKLLGLQYVTTGVIGFFAATFLFNILLCPLNQSSPNTETAGLFIFTAFLLSRSVIACKGYTTKIILSFLFLSSFLILYQMSGTITIDRFPYLLEPHQDEAYNWYPMTVQYFEKGLLHALQNHTMPGYGLFVHHVWVSVKRLLFLLSDGSFYLIPKFLLVFIQGVNRVIAGLCMSGSKPLKSL